MSGVRPERPSKPRVASLDAYRLVGWLILIVPFLPLRLVFGGEWTEKFLVTPGEWLLGVGIFGGLAWLVAWTFPGGVARLGPAAARVLARPPERRFAWGTLAVVAALLAAVSVFAFARRPLHVDSIVQLFQAEIFASGRLTAPSPPVFSFFVTQNMLSDAGGWYAQYPPGHAAALAIGVIAGAPWLVPILLSTASAALLYRFAKRAFDSDTARLTLLLLPFTPFFWFLGASHMNHVSALFGIVLFLNAFVAWEAEPERWLRMAGAGAALGLAFLSRPLTAVAVGAVFAGSALRTSFRSRDWRPPLAGAAAFLLVAALYLAFNAGTTGDPLLPGYLKLWGASHGLGFHESPWGELHTPLVGIRNELLDLSLLNVFLFEWPLPSLLPIGIAFAAGWTRQRWERRLITAFLALPAAYLFYWHRDAFLGPRFLYAGTVFLVPLTARAIILAGIRTSGRRWRLPGGDRRISVQGFLLLVVAMSVVYSAALATPRRFIVYRTGLASMKLDLRARVEEAGVRRAVVLVAVSWGNRILSRLRGAGIPASLAEKAYRNLDHCSLEELLRGVESGSERAATLEPEIQRMLTLDIPVEEADLNGDRTLRLTPGRELTPACRQQIRADSAGYANFAPSLPANDPSLEGPFVFARDLGELNAELLSRYPDREAWIYRPGRLDRIR